MKITRKLGITLVVSASLIVGSAGSALALDQQVGGGHWIWGTNTPIWAHNNYSYYEHSGKWHSSAVEGDAGIARSGPVRPGPWARAIAWDSNHWRIDGAWWNAW